MVRILAIETSCDETAAAVVEDGYRILSSVVASQVDLHARYGGVFPELAGRLHVEAIAPVIAQAMQQAQLDWGDLDAVAVTRGPGLAGSLVVGVNAAKGVALARGLPLLGINHLEGHVYAHWLELEDKSQANQGRPTGGDKRSFPLLFLIVSGGHTELILMRDHGQYELLGQTMDDAAGEAFDKVGRLLKLGYPGGPAIEKAAQGGNPTAYRFAMPKLDGVYDFSFSGVKTAALRLVQSKGETGPDGQLPYGLCVNDIAASFQAAVVEQLVNQTAAAAQDHAVKAVLLSGGVSANRALRAAMQARLAGQARQAALADQAGYAAPVYWSPLWLCTDNAAMIGAAAFWRYRAGERAAWDMEIEPTLRLA